MFTVGNVDCYIGRHSIDIPSVDTRSTVGREVVDSRSTVDRVSTDSSQTVDRQLIDSRSSVGEVSVT